MNRFKPSRKRIIYRLIGGLILEITILGTFFSCSSSVDYFGPPEDYVYDIRYDPIFTSFLFLIIGIPLFLFFEFLARRAGRKQARINEILADQ